ncbi:MAG: helicase-related protein [Candidatus Kapabacteria bacterium]|nr:helicase-related protein [Candidatus Kapabacteria bacterium]
MPVIYDNIDKKLVNALSETLAKSLHSDFCIGYFNLRGWDLLSDHIDKYDGTEQGCCRLLIGMNHSLTKCLRGIYSNTDELIINQEDIPDIIEKIVNDFKNQITIGVPTKKDEITLLKLKDQLLENKVKVKLYYKYPLHAKLFINYGNWRIDNKPYSFLGSSNLTFSGLQGNGELNIDVEGVDENEKLVKWFNDRWSESLDISKKLIEVIENGWTKSLIEPYYIYLKIIYHLSREARAGLSEYSIPKEFNEILFDFQKQAVKIATHHIRKIGGIIIGDVVGLGKTLTACTIAKIFEELELAKTLIICPPKLGPMWQEHIDKYDLKAVVMSIGETHKLKTAPRYPLVIIDESHNFRNIKGQRYSEIQEYIRFNDSKVILLTATPYNKTYLDLYAQIALFIDENKEIPVRPEKFILSLGNVDKFRAKYQCEPNTLKAFLHSEFIEDWQNLMRYVLIRRTRGFIKSISPRDESGKPYLEVKNKSKMYFPYRKVDKVEFSLKENDSEDQYAKLYSEIVVGNIGKLDLPRYGLQPFLIDDFIRKATKEEREIINILSYAGKRLQGFAKTNLFKRLESSGYSFLLSVSRHILKNYFYIYSIDNNKLIPFGNQENNEIELLDDIEEKDVLDEEKEDNEKIDSDKKEKKESEIKDIAFSISPDYYLKKAEELYKKLDSNKKKYKWIKSSLFKPALRKQLEADIVLLIQIISLSKNWQIEKDRKLAELYKFCTETNKDSKILIFTQYADTVKYIKGYFTNKKVQNFEAITSQNSHPEIIVGRFSPKSNNKVIDQSEEVRVLITTDVLSEGQNLQDCNIIVNYDLPWALIRLIQRAGRVDRIGQKAEIVHCYSFLPEKGIDKIINLRKRLNTRINEAGELVGNDELFFEGDVANIQDLYTGNSDILNEENDLEIDLASYCYQIWKISTEANPYLEKLIPNLSNSIHTAMDNVEDGIVVYTRTKNDNDILTYVDKNGKILTESHYEILKKLECKLDTKAIEITDNHYDVLKNVIGAIEQTENIVHGGQLGPKNSPRHRAYDKLDNYMKHDSSFQLKKVHESLFKYPLTSYARNTILRKLKEAISDKEFCDLLCRLYEDKSLSQVPNISEQDQFTQLICSMEFIKNES